MGIAGSINVLLTNPFWVVVTRMQLDGVDKRGNQKGVVSVVEEVLSEPAGAAGLFTKGLAPALMMVSNPAIVFMAFETFAGKARAALKRKSGSASLSSAHIFLIGAFAKLIATLITFPMLVVKSRHQSLHKLKSNGSSSVLDTVNGVVKEHGGWPWGLAGMYHGLKAKVMQTV